MDSQITTSTAADEDAIRPIHQRMIDAWNAGDAAASAAPFTDEAGFVAFEGTHLKGRREIASFHHRIFDSVVKGTRLQGRGEVRALLERCARRDALRGQGDAAGANRGVTVARFDATDSGG